MFEKLFKLSEHQTTVKTEVMAGITTFMTMAYILAVNPSILGSTGMDPTAVLLATALASFIGTACMAFMANLPFVLSAGMGLNAYMAYTVVRGLWLYLACCTAGCICRGSDLHRAVSDKRARGDLQCDSVDFKARCVRRYRSVHRIYRSSECGTFSRLFHTGNDHQLPGKFPYRRYLCAAGADRSVYHGGFIHLSCEGRDSVRHSGNLDSRYAVPGKSHLHPDVENGFYTLFPTLGITDFSKLGETFGKCFTVDFDAVGIINFIVVIFSFLFVDIFDTLGTLIGVATKADMLDVFRRPALMAGDRCIGASTTTTFVESASGVAVGGRTGLTALASALLFLLSTLFAPILRRSSLRFAPALIMVGFLMVGTVTEIRFDEDNIAEAIPAYLAIIAMPLFYSISEGISMGIISYVLFECGSRKSKEDYSLCMCWRYSSFSNTFPVTTCNNLTPENLTKTGFS